MKLTLLESPIFPLSFHTLHLSINHFLWQKKNFLDYPKTTDFFPGHESLMLNVHCVNYKTKPNVQKKKSHPWCCLCQHSVSSNLSFHHLQQSVNVPSASWVCTCLTVLLLVVKPTCRAQWREEKKRGKMPCAQLLKCLTRSSTLGWNLKKLARSGPQAIKFCAKPSLET